MQRRNAPVHTTGSTGSTGSTISSSTPQTSGRRPRRPRFLAVLVALMATLAAGLVSSPAAGAEENTEYFFLSVASELALDVRYDVEVFQAEPNGSDTQLWFYEFRDDNAVVIRNVATGRCLDVPYASDESGLGIVVWECGGYDNQAWTIAPVTDEFFTLTSVATGLALELPNSNAGTQVVQRPLTNSIRQQWGFAYTTPPADVPDTTPESTEPAVTSPASSSLSSELIAYIRESFEDVSAYWRRTSSEDSSANFVLFEGGAVSTACRGDVYAAAYCAADDTIFLPVSDVTTFVDGYGDFSVATVIAHEYGHNVQYELGLSANGDAKELQADCFAGAWAADANRRGRVASGQFNRALELFGALGSVGHGSGQERRDAVLAGWMSGAEHCANSFR